MSVNQFKSDSRTAHRPTSGGVHTDSTREGGHRYVSWENTMNGPS
jgi:hypothetical protein